jgi:hypothetical protein
MVETMELTQAFESERGKEKGFQEPPEKGLVE